MWLCVENPLTLNKSIILITSKKESPTHWIVRLEDNRRNIGSNYQQCDAEHFLKLAFKTLEENGPLEVLICVICK